MKCAKKSDSFYFLRAAHIRPARENNRSTSLEIPQIAKTFRATLLKIANHVELSIQNSGVPIFYLKNEKNSDYAEV